VYRRKATPGEQLRGEAANQYLEQEYLPQHNRRFAREPRQPEDYHGRKPTAREWHEIFRLETERALGNDWVIPHHGRYLQLQPGQRRYGPSPSKALLCEYKDGVVEVYYRGERMRLHEIVEPAREVAEAQPATAPIRVGRKAKPDHPWRLGYQMRVGSRAPLAAPSGCPASFRFPLKSRATLQDAGQQTTFTRKGTFLTSFDNPSALSLTLPPAARYPSRCSLRYLRPLACFRGPVR
jgi:hypothetical protein